MRRRWRFMRRPRAPVARAPRRAEVTTAPAGPGRTGPGAGFLAGSGLARHRFPRKRFAPHVMTVRFLAPIAILLAAALPLAADPPPPAHANWALAGHDAV